MRAAITTIILLLLACHGPELGNADPRPSYSAAVEALDTRRQALSEKWKRPLTAQQKAAVEAELVTSVERLTSYWLGTRWALGAPQTKVPGEGKVNCGTFVGQVLRDAGFNVKVRKLQRQPSQLIIQSFVGGKRVRKFSNRPMKKFLASVRAMGPGLFIIGLDFHVGFLLQTETELRFIHASFETNTVVNEDAATAMPITTSAYKVVGKILSPKNIESWLRGHAIVVKGDW